jgi:hypothetical protein
MGILNSRPRLKSGESVRWEALANRKQGARAVEIAELSDLLLGPSS